MTNDIVDITNLLKLAKTKTDYLEGRNRLGNLTTAGLLS